MKEALSLQHRFPFFPVDFKEIEAEIRFVVLVPEETTKLLDSR
jgi:hypothetical protein